MATAAKIHFLARNLHKNAIKSMMTNKFSIRVVSLKAEATKTCCFVRKVHIVQSAFDVFLKARKLSTRRVHLPPSFLISLSWSLVRGRLFASSVSKGGKIWRQRGFSHPSRTCSAPNPGFGIWDFDWNLAIRVKFGTCEQNWDFFGTKNWDFQR